MRPRAEMLLGGSWVLWEHGAWGVDTGVRVTSIWVLARGDVFVWG